MTLFKLYLILTSEQGRYITTINLPLVLEGAKLLIFKVAV